MKRKLVVGFSLKNYINTNKKTKKLCEAMKQLCGTEEQIEQFLFPSLGTIQAAQDVLHESSIGVGAQNIAPEQNGAFTGEYSIETLLEVGGKYVEIGHNERIHLFNESFELINQKIKLALDNHITPVVCIGEGNVQLSIEGFRERLEEQLTHFLQDVEIAEAAKIIFAYEPGWAIGKAQAADTGFVHQAHKEIRALLEKRFDKETAEKMRIIYGGSVSKENTGELMSSEEVDGVFIGRFGHEPKNYQQIVSLVKNSREGV